MPAILNPRTGKTTFVNNRVGGQGKGIFKPPPPPPDSMPPLDQPLIVPKAKLHRVAVMRRP